MMVIGRGVLLLVRTPPLSFRLRLLPVLLLLIPPPSVTLLLQTVLSVPATWRAVLLTLLLLLVICLLPKLLNIVVKLYEAGRQRGTVLVRPTVCRLLEDHLVPKLRAPVLQQLTRGAVGDVAQTTALVPVVDRLSRRRQLLVRHW